MQNINIAGGEVGSADQEASEKNVKKCYTRKGFMWKSKFSMLMRLNYFISMLTNE